MDMYMIISLLLIIAVFYFFMIRPENKKKKQMAEMRANLKVGDEITTIGGVIGTICQLKEDTIVLETGADRVRIEFTKWAISTVGAQTQENVPAKKKAAKEAKETKESKETKD